MFEVTGLSNSDMYYWRVSATNGLGSSDWSGVWSFTTSITGVGDEQEIPSAYSLSQNYPNPFNPSTTIPYGMPEKSHVRLQVFNLLGQRVALLVDGEQEAGYHSTVFEARGLASGVYIYRLTARTFVQTKRLLLLR